LILLPLTLPVIKSASTTDQSIKLLRIFAPAFGEKAYCFGENAPLPKKALKIASLEAKY
jgi:hypothetical protein